MRKLSKQILKEIHLTNALRQLSSDKYNEFHDLINSMLNFESNELESLERLAEFTNRNDELAEYVQMKLIEHSKLILAKLGGLTMDQFEQKIKEIEDADKEYQRRKGLH